MNKDEIKKAASLSMIEVEDIDEIKKELCAILRFLESIPEIESEKENNVSKTIQLSDLREDFSEEFIGSDEILKNAPNLKNGLVKVPLMIKKNKKGI